MNIPNSKKLTGILLACTLMLGGAISASAAEPTTEMVKVIASTEMTKAILLEDAAMAIDGANVVSVQFTPLEGATSDGMTVSVVPLAKLMPLSDAKTFDGQDTIPAIRLVPAKSIPMEKLILE